MTAELPAGLPGVVIYLRTLDDAMGVAWHEYFGARSDVTIAVGNILDETPDAFLSPANSFGFMDGGIDLAYSHHFGWELQAVLRDRLVAEHDGELPVGHAVVVATGHPVTPYLISAPTMRVPSRIDRTANVYLAFRAALLAIRRHNASSTHRIASVASPALGAGVGAMPVDRVARQMRAAHAEVVDGDTTWRETARGVLGQHASLLR